MKWTGENIRHSVQWHFGWMWMDVTHSRSKCPANVKKLIANQMTKWRAMKYSNWQHGHFICCEFCLMENRILEPLQIFKNVKLLFNIVSVRCKICLDILLLQNGNFWLFFLIRLIALLKVSCSDRSTLGLEFLHWNVSHNESFQRSWSKPNVFQKSNFFFY